MQYFPKEADSRGGLCLFGRILGTNVSSPILRQNQKARATTRPETQNATIGRRRTLSRKRTLTIPQGKSQKHASLEEEREVSPQAASPGK